MKKIRIVLAFLLCFIFFSNNVVLAKEITNIYLGSWLYAKNTGITYLMDGVTWDGDNKILYLENANLPNLSLDDTDIDTFNNFTIYLKGNNTINDIIWFCAQSKVIITGDKNASLNVVNYNLDSSYLGSTKELHIKKVTVNYDINNTLDVSYLYEDGDGKDGFYGNIYVEEGAKLNVTYQNGYNIIFDKLYIGENVSVNLKIPEKYNIFKNGGYSFLNGVSKNDFIISDNSSKGSFSIKSKNNWENPFVDVSESSWYYSAVKYTNSNNIISGYNETIFAPNDKLTRGMLVTILYRMEGSPKNDGKSRFEDVSYDKWYAKAVKWAAENKIVNGYKNTNNFGPTDNILRQDLAVILRNYAKYKNVDVNKLADLSKFSDAQNISGYAETAVKWAVSKKVITGNGDRTLNPKGNATRAEAAAMIQKYCINIGR